MHHPLSWMLNNMYKEGVVRKLQIPVFKYDSVNRSAPDTLLRASWGLAKAYELHFLLSYQNEMLGGKTALGRSGMWGKGAAQREQRFVTLNSVVRDICSSCARCSATGVWQVWWAEPVAPMPAKQIISNLLIYLSSKEKLGMGRISNN